MTASPISRMGTSVGMAAGSLAERHDAHHQPGGDNCEYELAALVEHALFDDLSRLQAQRLWDGQPKVLAVLRLITHSIVVGRSAGFVL
jgi:hypothetical protein